MQNIGRGKGFTLAKDAAVYYSVAEGDKRKGQTDSGLRPSAQIVLFSLSVALSGLLYLSGFGEDGLQYGERREQDLPRVVLLQLACHIHNRHRYHRHL